MKMTEISKQLMIDIFNSIEYYSFDEEKENGSLVFYDSINDQTWSFFPENESIQSIMDFIIHNERVSSERIGQKKLQEKFKKLLNL